ncbi:MAG: hypothetical protein NZ602_00700 [Thermoguttaceae bacterium]|nr:hypothetical protein [Thermoguttaceae bacterium]MDW8038970.1 hypothetical protein [Thermoguttaceae bacterium]
MIRRVWRPNLSTSLRWRVQLEQIGLERLGVRIPDPAEVFDYLVRFPEMILVVDEVVRIAAKRLPDAQLTLQVYHDAEIEEEYLTLYARFNFYDETTMERVRAVRDQYRPLLRNRSGWLLFTTDFRPPE